MMRVMRAIKQKLDAVWQCPNCGWFAFKFRNGMANCERCGMSESAEG